MTNVYGYMLQEVLRHTKAPNYVKLITFGCSSESRWGNVLSKGVEPATMSGGFRWVKHATGKPNEGKPVLMNSKGSWWKHCNTLTLSSYRNWIGETAEFFWGDPQIKNTRRNFRVVSGTDQHPATFTLRATQRQASCKVLAGRGIFSLMAVRISRKIPQKHSELRMIYGTVNTEVLTDCVKEIFQLLGCYAAYNGWEKI